MIRFFICMIVFLLPHILRSQEDFRIGKSYSINSSILKEECNYWISLPTDYDANKTDSYPLIILLDGDKYFPVVEGIRQMYQSGRINLIPNAILVGLKSNDRTRDFTPTCSKMGRDGKIDLSKKATGGEALIYTRFLSEELIPMIEKKFRVSSERLLIGHSYGGLFALNIFLHHSNLFTH